MKAESINETISAGGTRYMVQIKGGLPKFYGEGSQSNYSKSKEDLQNENQSRIEYDNISQN